MALTVLDAAAHAFAIVCLADGRLVPLEERRFLSFVADDPAFTGRTPEAAAAAWLKAFRAVSRSPDYSACLPVIAEAAASPVDKATLMRAAQGALIADRVEAPQEAGAIERLAQALGLEPRAY